MKHLESWKALEQHTLDIKKVSLTELFNNDPNRGTSFSAGDTHIFLDYSKNHLTETTLDLFKQYCDEIQLDQKVDDLLSGKNVNTTENRSALHCSIRDPENKLCINSNIHNTIFTAQKKAFDLANQINQNKLLNHKNIPFKHLICLGIGGSFLGPKLVFDALKAFHKTNIAIHFVASIDPIALDSLLENINIEECLFFIASKSFNTIETLSNAQHIKELLLKKAIPKHQLEQFFISATENIEAALNFGCKQEFILPIWNFIGGRFSLWSNIGFPLMLALGEEQFSDLLNGGHEMDIHFKNAPIERNMPVLLGLIAFWYQTFLGINNRAIIPYSHTLKLLPAFLQQLEMESLGKSVDLENNIIDYPTGGIIWGSEGPGSQHAFHQLLMQGNIQVVSDFIITNCQNKDYRFENLLHQALAQSKALAFGTNSKNSYQAVKGNRASNTIIIEELNPKNIGALIALYEHKTFVLSVLLNINCFDQWGVQLGKAIAAGLGATNNTTQPFEFDSSTNTLLKILFNN